MHVVLGRRPARRGRRARCGRPAILLARRHRASRSCSRSPLVGGGARRSCARPRSARLGAVVERAAPGAVVVVADRRRRGDARLRVARAALVRRRAPLRRRSGARRVGSRSGSSSTAAVPLVDRERPAARVGDARVGAGAGVVRARVAADALSATAPVPAPEGVLVPGRARPRARGRARRERAARRHAPLALRLAAGVGGRGRGRARAAVARVRGRHRVGPLAAARAPTGRPRSRGWATCRAPGGFRVLWLGDPAVLPGRRQGRRRHRLRADARRRRRRARAVGRAAARRRRPCSRSALLAARGGRHRAARSSARAARRALRRRWSAGWRRVTARSCRPIPMLADALTRQLDLSVSRIDDGAIVYAERRVDPAPRGRSGRHATCPRAPGAGLDGRGAQRRRRRCARGVGGPVRPVRRRPGPGTLLWAEAANGGWHATRRRAATSTRTSAFDWTNAFALPAARVGRHPLPRRAASAACSSSLEIVAVDRRDRRVAPDARPPRRRHARAMPA